MRPNILFIMTDQLRYDAISEKEGSSRYTPNLDALADCAVQFTNCFTTSPICAPARASLLSALYPHQMGIWNNDPHIFPKKAKNWVKILKAQGYRTSIFGKTHYYPYNGSVPDMRQAEPLLAAYGYDDIDEIPGPRVSGKLLSHMTALWKEKGYLDIVREDLQRRYSGKHTCTEPSPLPLSLYPDVYVGSKANEYLRAYDRSEPFFCFVSFGGPHDPWDCPTEYSKRFDSCKMQTPRPCFTDNNPDRPQGVWDEEQHHPPLDMQDIEAVRKNYAGKVSLIDEQIGMLFDTLRKKNVWDDTLIIFTSDHGEMLGDCQRLYKQNFLEPSVHIPLLVKQPYQTTAVQSNALVELLDIGPTFVDYAETTMDYPAEGISLRGLCEQTQESIRGVQFSEYNQEIMVFDGRWKLVVNKEKEPYLLFDLESDPFEQSNVVTFHPDEEVRLLKAIERHLQETEGRGFYYESE